MRAVLDTNVLARVVMSPGGPAAEVFDRICADHVLVICAQMLTELSRVLSYERVRRVHGLDDDAIEEFVDRIATGSLTIPLPHPLPRVVPTDADDDCVVATAVAGQAEVLCTRNLKHLAHPDVVAYCRQHAIEIMDDLALLKRLRRSDEDESG